jgi:cellulose synthase/poly-beta-1,6-N-acetylglucosamine synthase-like glycosyltransferase
MLLILTAVFLLCYAFLIFYYFYYWLHVKELPLSNDNFTISVSVVIAARNEEENIARLLEALHGQTYPKDIFEVIVVDDFSTDKTVELIKPFLNDTIHLIQPNANTAQSSKKKAIEAGIQKAKGELIVITDADCIPQQEWLQTIVSFYKKTNSVFIAAPVKLKSYPTLLSIFQSLDFITLQGITAASVTANSHTMCNGANLAYLRSAFFEVEGFSGIDKLASGDDMLLMYKIWKKYPEKVNYLKSEQAIVETEPMLTWKDFFQQRIRWSSKAGYYKDWRISSVLFFVYLFNCLFFVLLVACFLNSYYWYVLAFYLLGKLLIEFPFVYSVARFYKAQKLLVYFAFLQPLHITYTVVIGLAGQFGTYQWKGRKTK